MKQYLSTTLAIVCTVSILSFILMKRSDDAQHENDAGAIADFSNRLDSAQTQIAVCEGAILTFSNSLAESQSASLTFSNQLMEAESTIALGTAQITNLNRRTAEMESENQTLSQRIMDLTNQVTGLTKQIAVTQVSLAQAKKDYSLLENRLRADVAGRIVVERKFNNLLELQAQIQNLKKNPAEAISADNIYTGLGVEENSNGTLRVISPD